MAKLPLCKRNAYINFLCCFILKETVKINENIYFDWCSITHSNKPDWLSGNFFVL